MKHKIVEVFHSIQGEGTHAGTSSVFIRYFGCNLACDFGHGFVCDEVLHTDASMITEYTTDELVQKMEDYHFENIVITGGEPSIQPGIAELIEALQEAGYYVQIETNGAKMEMLRNADWITYSPKFMFDKKASQIKGGFHELKLLAGKHNPIDETQWTTVKNKYVQPIGNEHDWDSLNVLYCITFVLTHPKWKLSLQLHKLLGLR